MSNNAKTSVRSQQRSISERLTGLEQNFTRFLIGANTKIGDHEARLGALEEKIEALVELAGAADVEMAINRLRVERSRAEAAIEKARLDEGIADGYVIKAEKVDENSLIIGRLIKDGEVVEPGRLQMTMPKIRPEIKPKLLGQAAGAVVDLDNGSKFELTEIYIVDVAKAQEVAKARQESAEKAAQEIAAAEEAQEAADAVDPNAPAVPAAAASVQEEQPQVEG